MLEKNTDRLFWTLTSIIVGALLLTISVKAFPGVANSVVQPISGITKQADTSTKTADQAYKDATNSNGNSGSNNNSSQSTPTFDPDAQLKANAVEASTLNLKVTPNGDGTGVLVGTISGQISGNLSIPSYVKINGQLNKITSIGDNAFNLNSIYLSTHGITPNGQGITTLNIPDTITSIGNSAFDSNSIETLNLSNNIIHIGDNAFANNGVSSITFGNNIQTIGTNAFYWNHITNINLPKSVVSVGDSAFYGDTIVQTLNTANPNTKLGSNVINTTGSAPYGY